VGTGFSMAEAARELGVSVSLIRRYEREFNLQFERNEQGRRVLSEQDLTNLRIIRSFREQNLPLDEIKAMLGRTEVVPTETESQGPDIKEVIAALVARQDDLEAIVQQQQQAIAQLIQENRALQASSNSLRLLLEAPKDHAEIEALDNRLEALETRAKAIDETMDAETKDELIRKLQRRLLDLEAAVATELSDDRDDEGILDELARAIQQQAAQQAPRKWWQFWR